MNKTRVTELLRITYPIIQAGMAGTITTPDLVAAVSNAGGLGTLGAGYMQPEEIRAAIQQIRQQTTKPFAVNLLITRNVHANPQDVERAKRLLEPARQVLGLTALDKELQEEHYKEKLAVLIEEKIPVFSFAFDAVSLSELETLKRNGTKTIGTATNVREAKVLANMGVNLIVGQGSEAGGHRGTFLGDVHTSMIGTMALIPQLVDALPHTPIIAAGGIMDGRGLAAALALGAEAVQMGTAFLTCTESGTHRSHQQAILQSSDQSTKLTRVFSGRYARGIANQLMNELQPVEQELPPYPIQNTLTAEIRKEAAKQNKSEYMSLWAGQAASMARKESACALIGRIVAQANERIRVLG